MNDFLPQNINKEMKDLLHCIFISGHSTDFLEVYIQSELKWTLKPFNLASKVHTTP